jgi:hypothetical protein
MLLCSTIELFESESESRLGGPAATVVVVVVVVVVVGATVVVVVVVVVVVGATVVVVLRAVTRTREFPTTVTPPGIGSKRGIQSPPGASGLIQNSP